MTLDTPMFLLCLHYFNEVVGELSSCFLNLFLMSFPVCISESQDASC